MAAETTLSMFKLIPRDRIGKGGILETKVDWIDAEMNKKRAFSLVAQNELRRLQSYPLIHP